MLKVRYWWCWIWWIWLVVLDKVLRWKSGDGAPSPGPWTGTAPATRRNIISGWSWRSWYSTSINIPRSKIMRWIIQVNRTSNFLAVVEEFLMIQNQTGQGAESGGPYAGAGPGSYNPNGTPLV